MILTHDHKFFIIPLIESWGVMSPQAQECFDEERIKEINADFQDKVTLEHSLRIPKLSCKKSYYAETSLLERRSVSAPKSTAPARANPTWEDWPRMTNTKIQFNKNTGLKRKKSSGHWDQKRKWSFRKRKRNYHQIF